MRSYRFIDWATQGFLAAVIGIVAVAAARRDGIPDFWPTLIAAHVAAMVVIHGLVRFGSAPGSPAVFQFFREFYPILLYTAFYRETELVNRILGTARLDPAVVRLENLIFGSQPSVELMLRFPSRAVSELLYASYFSYYLMIGGVGLFLLYCHPMIFRHFVAVVSFVFYVCYLTYMFVPVVGPRLFFQDTPERQIYLSLYKHLPPGPPETVQSGIFFHVMAWIYETFEAAAAAFPSSHVAIAITTVWFSWQYLWPIRWVHSVVVALLCLSTVYCRYHYTIDVPAGILFAVVLIPMANRLYWYYDRPAPIYPKVVRVDRSRKQPVEL